MATVVRFEDLQVWQKARVFLQKNRALGKVGIIARDFDIANQIVSAARSVLYNIAEGFGRHSDLQFSQSLIVARGSVTEVQCALYEALDNGFVDPVKFEELFAESQEISKMLFALSRYLRGGTRKT